MAGKGMIYVFVVWQTRGKDHPSSDVMAFGSTHNYRKQFGMAMARAAKAEGYEQGTDPTSVLTILDFRPIQSPATMMAGD